MFTKGTHGHRTFIVAELSGNHHQHFEEAVALVRAAKEAGADAVKLQTYTPETITLNADSDPFIVKGKDQPADWKGERLWDLYKKAHTPWDWQPKLKALSDELEMVLFSSPFDDSAVRFLEEQVHVDLYKVASYEAVHIPLLRTIGATRKPVILSIGYANGEEIQLAVDTLRKSGAPEIVLLHCVTAYSGAPTLEDMNFATIPDIRTRFGVEAGFSDNNAGILAPVIAAVAFGASVVEKHLTLSRADGGPDAMFSIEPHEFADMVARIRRGEKEGIETALEGIGGLHDVEKARGHVQYGPASEVERQNMMFRPSIWAKKDIKQGEVFTADNVRVARPANGLSPRYWDILLGKTAAADIAFATPISGHLIDGNLQNEYTV